MPAVMHQTPKISRAMWESLKIHIMKQRERVKQEEEADAEEERQRKEKERKRKADELTIEDTKEKISKLETELLSLKSDKHDLFLSLKKVLHEDETRKRQLSSKENNEMFGIPAVYPSGHMPLGGHHSHMLMHPMAAVGAPGGRMPLYSKIGAPMQQVPVHTQAQASVLPPPPGATLKRPRSPSPQPPGYQQGYPYKTAPYPPQKHVGGGSHYGNAAASAFYPPPAPVPMTQPHASSSYSYQFPTVTSSEAAKHASAYAHQNRGSSTSRSARLSVPQGTSILPIQQTAPKGSITSGYPVRPPPQSIPFQVPTTHQSIYSHPNTAPRLSYSQQHQMRY